MSGPDRMKRLGGRVRWLDRYRRVVAICVALVAGPLLIWYLMGSLRAEWPLVSLPTLMTGVVVWWGVEVVLASLTAIWETEFEQLVDARGLPRAELVGIRNEKRRRRL
jgi:hypothetical protein